LDKHAAIDDIQSSTGIFSFLNFYIITKQ
jgi:hypothetical protein